MSDATLSGVKVFAESWLSLQCRIISGARRAVVMLGAPDSGSYIRAAVWPDGKEVHPRLVTAAESAIAGRRYVVQAGDLNPGTSEEQPDIVAYPLILRRRLIGVVAVEITARSDSQRHTVVQLLKWGAAWLEILFLEQDSVDKGRLATVIDVLAGSLEHERFRETVTAVATDLATRLACERVSIGFVKGRYVQIRAVSHNARFEKKANLIQGIEAAMDEAIDQQHTLVYPPSADQETPLITRAQAELAERQRSGGVCTVPMSVGGRLIGALTLERSADRPFEPETIELCGHLAALLGPTLELKRKDDRWLLQKSWDSFKSFAGKLLGRGHWLLKTAGVSTLGVFLFLYFGVGDYRVAANAVLEPEMQRAVVAPIDGYILDAEARAGDMVQADDLLAKLEDKDLRLEYLKWESQKAQLRKEYRKAYAGHDRTQVAILKAQMKQAEAQIELVQEQLARIRLVAPFDGIIVNGDLSQKLGSPVERGDLLFEVAPLDDYRVILQVDERDISDIGVGQRGSLALSGLPVDRLPLVVEKITPVSTAKAGENFFRVEARLEQSNELLRPGMEGVGKIDIDQRKLVWIWTHKLVDWLRLWTWSWWPL